LDAELAKESLDKLYQITKTEKGNEKNKYINIYIRESLDKLIK
jgi:hypothetical protein